MSADFQATHLWTSDEDPDIVNVPVELGQPVLDREQAEYGARYAETEAGDVVWTWPHELTAL